MPDRPPVQLRLREMLRSLTAAEIEFLVFGAIAAGLYGHVRATADLDIVIRPTAENRERAIAWLTEQRATLGSDPQSGLKDRHRRALQLGRNAWIVTPFGQLDIVQHIDGLPDWETLSARAATFELDDMTVRAVDRDTLIDRKRRRATPQDLVDADALEALGGDETSAASPF